MNTLTHLKKRKLTRTYKYKHAKTLHSNRLRCFTLVHRIKVHSFCHFTGGNFVFQDGFGLVIKTV